VLQATFQQTLHTTSNEPGGAVPALYGGGLGARAANLKCILQAQKGVCSRQGQAGAGASLQLMKRSALSCGLAGAALLQQKGVGLHEQVAQVVRALGEVRLCSRHLLLALQHRLAALQQRAHPPPVQLVRRLRLLLSGDTGLSAKGTEGKKYAGKGGRISASAEEVCFAHWNESHARPATDWSSIRVVHRPQLPWSMHSSGNDL